MHTFQFLYDEKIDGVGVIEFCTKNEREATKLFINWQKKNEYSIQNYEVTRID